MSKKTHAKRVERRRKIARETAARPNRLLGAPWTPEAAREARANRSMFDEYEVRLQAIAATFADEIERVWRDFPAFEHPAVVLTANGTCTVEPVRLSTNEPEERLPPGLARSMRVMQAIGAKRRDPVLAVIDGDDWICNPASTFRIFRGGVDPTEIAAVKSRFGIA